METFLKNRSFQIDFVLKYKDTGAAINLALLDEITIEVKHSLTKAILFTKTLTGTDVDITTAASGMCSIYINPSDTVNATAGVYEYVATIEYEDLNFDDDDSNPAGYGNCFILK